MGLGDSNGKKRFSNDYYSRVSITDQDSKLRLGYKFRNGMVIPTISKPKDGADFEFEDLEEIFITPTKARILRQLMDDYMCGAIDSCEGIGVTSGLKETVSVIVLHCKEDTKREIIGITIGKVNSNGEYVSQHRVDFNKSYNTGIVWSDVAANNFDKRYYDDTDYNTFYTLMKTFADSMLGSYAYSVADLTRFDQSRAAGRLKPIYEKLGIEWGGNYNGNTNYSGNNFYNNNTRNQGGTAEHRDFDEAMDELPFA